MSKKKESTPKHFYFREERENLPSGRRVTSFTDKDEAKDWGQRKGLTELWSYVYLSKDSDAEKHSKE